MYTFFSYSYDALLVGAPMYTEVDPTTKKIKAEIGRLYVYFNAGVR